MAKAICPVCDQLVGINPTGEKQREGWSAEWWSIDVHKAPDKSELCEGSGKRV